MRSGIIELRDRENLSQKSRPRARKGRAFANKAGSNLINVLAAVRFWNVEELVSTSRGSEYKAVEAS